MESMKHMLSALAQDQTAALKLIMDVVRCVLVHCGLLC